LANIQLELLRIELPSVRVSSKDSVSISAQSYAPRPEQGIRPMSRMADGLIEVAKKAKKDLLQEKRSYG
jgi:hypothetical protein